MKGDTINSIDGARVDAFPPFKVDRAQRCGLFFSDPARPEDVLIATFSKRYIAVKWASLLNRELYKRDPAGREFYFADNVNRGAK
jgi:hypothetical protein